jgi:DNA polymerase
MSFQLKDSTLWITLPSGRQLAYYEPMLKDSKFGGQSLCYKGMDQVRKIWGNQDTYGGKLVENITQAVARDCMAYAMTRLHAEGYKIVMHVHDEVVLEMPYGQGSEEQVAEIMSQGAPWAAGLPLVADGYETEYYKKD